MHKRSAAYESIISRFRTHSSDVAYPNSRAMRRLLNTNQLIGDDLGHPLLSRLLIALNPAKIQTIPAIVRAVSETAAASGNPVGL
jgi:hypothetical protein